MDEKPNPKTALAAIHDEALKLASINEATPAIRERADLIVSIARYGVDVRTDAERKRK